MRRVVVTGLGVVSSIGNDTAEVAESLRLGRSGIEFCEEYRDMGFRSQVLGTVKLNLEQVLDRKVRRFMGDGAAYNYIAMQEAIGDACLTEDQVSNERAGLVVGSGGPSTRSMLQAIDTTRDKGPRRVGPYMVPRCMSSTNSANLATQFKIRGVNYSITSACATSAHCIGHAADLIRLGRQDIMFAGGGEEIDWTLSVLFDGMSAMSHHYNDNPTKASRAYDAERDGFVISGGGGLVVLEDLEHAKARGAKIYAELVGYGATSDGNDMVQPSVDGQSRCMRQALADLGGQKIDYINTHGTSTPIGDTREVEAMRNVFGGDVPRFSSTKSLTGHSQGATGVHEAIYSLIMLRDDFIAASANVDKLDPEVEGMPIVTERVDDAKLELVMTNSFGFGGTNASLVFKRYDG